MKARKILAMVMALALTAALAVGGTLAYLTSHDSVTNTFTVGNVQIKLDEAKANTDGSLVANADRVKANSYKLLPGHEYKKDPMVTVLKDSEESFVKMTVTISNAKELDAIFASTGAAADMRSIFKGYNGETWIDKGNTEDTAANTRTYEFWYNGTVANSSSDTSLPALFTSIEVPGFITNDQLKTIANMTITVNAYAIQADGFNDAADAWAHF